MAGADPNETIVKALHKALLLDDGKGAFGLALTLPVGEARDHCVACVVRHDIRSARPLGARRRAAWVEDATLRGALLAKIDAMPAGVARKPEEEIRGEGITVAVNDNFFKDDWNEHIWVACFDDLEVARAYAARRIRHSLEDLRDAEDDAETLYRKWTALGFDVAIDGEMLGETLAEEFSQAQPALPGEQSYWELDDGAAEQPDLEAAQYRVTLRNWERRQAMTESALRSYTILHRVRTSHDMANPPDPSMEEAASSDSLGAPSEGATSTGEAYDTATDSSSDSGALHDSGASSDDASGWIVLILIVLAVVLVIPVVWWWLRPAKPDEAKAASKSALARQKVQDFKARKTTSPSVILIANAYAEDPEVRQELVGFASRKAALTYAKARVRSSIESFRQKEQSEAELKDLWRAFGEDAILVGPKSRARPRISIGTKHLKAFAKTPATPREQDFHGYEPASWQR